MNLETLNKILTGNKFPSVRSIIKVEVGFTNEVYSLDDQFILKICEDKNNGKAFKNEALFYEFFQNKLPVPKLLFYDDSKSLYAKPFMVYEKIQGENLYDVWHALTATARRKIIRQLCGFLKTINATNPGELPKGIQLKPVKNWRECIEEKMKKDLEMAKQMHSLTPKELEQIEDFVSKNGSALYEQKIALTYWDVHFDNILVRNKKIIGLLDFERTEWASIDFVLDTVKLMMEQPKKYMSKKNEHLAKQEDYKDLMEWYQEFYPELFQFKNLKTRLALYGVAHDLKDLKNWPHLEALKKHLLSELHHSPGILA